MRGATAPGTATPFRHGYSRTLALGQCGTGWAMLMQTHAISRSVSGRGSPPPARLIQVLGARVLVAGLVLPLRPTRRIAPAGAAVDTARPEHGRGSGGQLPIVDSRA